MQRLAGGTEHFFASGVSGRGENFSARMGRVWQNSLMHPRAIEPSLTGQFLERLQRKGFRGEVSRSDAQLTVYATDNSVYQRRPQAVIWPRGLDDLQAVMALAATAPFAHLVFTARGGGTGTNGQALTDGIVIDCSRYLNRIVAIDPNKRTATVQAGVVKDQLDAALKPYGLFFAPELSTANRATIGGMINTDASGQGSCRYGKTHDHVLALKTVLLGGEVLDSRSLAEADWPAAVAGKSSAQQALYHALYRLAVDNRELIDARFPRLNRSLTGYDLPHLVENGRFNINSVLCGSEGSLGMVAEATLKVLPLPQHRALIAVGYTDFQAALGDARALMGFDPLSIETVDGKVLDLARSDIVWARVAKYFPDVPGETVNGINLVEFDGATPQALEHVIAAFLAHVQREGGTARLSVTVARGAQNIAPLYEMRKRAVGLLGNVAGEKRPIPFVEDCAVPPEHLADFIAAFRGVLDEMGLAYGMFGHVDAGVLHVRPQLDLKAPASGGTIRLVSERVAALVQEYGGVLWGEHGKGLRSAFAPAFFGSAWPLIQEVKALFDPRNQLNPGKIATPATLPQAKLSGLTDVALRGERDRAIAPGDWHRFGNVMHCNGNGACFNYDYDDPMCPSYKYSRDRIHSPKGRAMLIKEWLYRKAKGTLDAAFEQELHAALDGCLSCKSCGGQCPVKVDIPDAKSRFLADYHRRHRRSLRDYALADLETLMPLMARVGGGYNAIQRLSPVKALLRKLFHLVDVPQIHIQAKRDIAATGAIALKSIAELPPNPRRPAVIVVQDAFTRYLDTPVFFDWLRLLHRLGVKVYVLPYFVNGKPLHVHGFRARFSRLREKNEVLLAQAAASGLPLIGLDPAMTLVFRQEYLQDLEHRPTRTVLLPQEWLSGYLVDHPPPRLSGDARYYLAAHCTEKTQLPESGGQWRRIFTAFGLTLESLATGCCGMAGSYGHEAEHVASSRGIYQLSWQEKVAGHADAVLATGYSCRCQVKRLAGRTLRHPVQVLLARLNQGQA